MPCPTMLHRVAAPSPNCALSLPATSSGPDSFLPKLWKAFETGSIVPIREPFGSWNMLDYFAPLAYLFKVTRLYSSSSSRVLAES